MTTHRIGVLGGDGIGPEVTAEGVKILRRAAELFGFGLDLVDYPFGADHCVKTKELIPDSAFSEIRQLDAVLLGAIGDPRFETGFLEFGIVGRLRFDLDLYVNLRPIKLYAEHLCPLKGKKPEHLDIVVVRENTEDAYRSKPRFENKGTPDEVAAQEMIYTRKGTERIIRYAYELAAARPRKKLTLVDKANAVRAHDLYRRVFDEVGREYPQVQKDNAFVDACCMWMVRNPEGFDTIVTTNMFGDIITDLGAVLQGGLGIAAGGNIHPGQVSVFEPIHGSAPKYKGQNKANPIAAILAGAMMLDHLGERDAAARIEQVVSDLLASGRIPSLQAGAMRTSEIGDLVAREAAAARSVGANP
ncbi:MAG: 3-isopropylmalate dehydrogenase [Planctomycetes bacterium]|nr:3-isopropylmalate dehydrogenase [Planctomycetota bacterium]